MTKFREYVFKNYVYNLFKDIIVNDNSEEVRMFVSVGNKLFDTYIPKQTVSYHYYGSRGVYTTEEKFDMLADARGYKLYGKNSVYIEYVPEKGSLYYLPDEDKLTYYEYKTNGCVNTVDLTDDDISNLGDEVKAYYWMRKNNKSKKEGLEYLYSLMNIDYKKPDVEEIAETKESVEVSPYTDVLIDVDEDASKAYYYDGNGSFVESDFNSTKGVIVDKDTELYDRLKSIILDVISYCERTGVNSTLLQESKSFFV